MTYYAPNKALAERAAAQLTASTRIGRPPAGEGPGRTVTGYVVKEYATPDGTYRDDQSRFEWGVVERWRYDDRPDLPEMGGSFVSLAPEMWA